MAKNKNKYNNVVIKDEELTPTTIGVYSNKTKNPITLILLIAAFISIAVFMPDIQSYVNKYLGKSTTNNGGNSANINNNQNNNNNSDDDVAKKDNKYEISSTSNVETTDYDLKNIKYEGSIMSFTFVNKTQGDYDLSDYYLEFYSSDNTFLGRIKISNDVIGLNDSEDYSFTIFANAAKFSFDKKTVADYPDVKLVYTDNVANYTCKNGNKRYTYQFVENQLTKIIFVYNLENTASNYYEEYNDYQNKYQNYGLITGVNVSFSSTLTNFNYNLNVDLSVADISKIKDDNLYKSKTTPSEVKFKAEAQGLTCSQ
ncbi:MAG: hypothetical protein IKX00_04885 [Bacilli bacterium]|nr:hypothetical protein [Bacilli bacterium]